MRIIYRTIFKVANQDDINTEGMETAEDYGDWLRRKKLLTDQDYEIGQDKAKQLIISWQKVR